MKAVSQRTIERDRLFVQLTESGIPAERAGEMVDRTLPELPVWKEERDARLARERAERDTRRTQQAEPDDDDQDEAAPAPAARTKRTATWAIGAAALAFGIIGWVLGGAFTLDGWISWVNTILGIVRLPFALPEASGAWRLLFIPIALIYSRVETKHRPIWRDAQKRWHFEPALFWVGFLLITLTDIGSTAFGLLNTDPKAWGALKPTVAWIVADGWRAGATATILTFVPEWLILGGAWLLRR